MIIAVSNSLIPKSQISMQKHLPSNSTQKIIKVAKKPFSLIQSVLRFLNKLEERAHGAIFNYNEDGRLLFSIKPRNKKSGEKINEYKCYYNNEKTRLKEIQATDSNVILERKDYNQKGKLEREVFRNHNGKISHIKLHEYDYENKIHTISDYDKYGFAKRISYDMSTKAQIIIENGPNKTIIEPRVLGTL